MYWALRPVSIVSHELRVATHASLSINFVDCLQAVPPTRNVCIPLAPFVRMGTVGLKFFSRRPTLNAQGLEFGHLIFDIDDSPLLLHAAVVSVLCVTSRRPPLQFWVSMDRAHWGKLGERRKENCSEIQRIWNKIGEKLEESADRRCWGKIGAGWGNVWSEAGQYWSGVRQN